MNNREEQKFSCCPLCKVQITESNDSNDHIIPNSIGGRRKVKKFLCKNCDNRCGHEWDLALATQLQPLSLFLKIKRERGDVPAQEFETTKGEKVRIQSDGSMTLSKPDFQIKELGDQGELRINARTPEEAKKMLNGFKRKYPDLDIEESIRNAEHKSYKLQDPLKISIGFDLKDSGKSVVKSTLALAVENGIDPKSCPRALKYLKDEGAEKCFGFYYERDLLLNRPQNRVFHCVAISGNSRTGCLFGYVEYFGTQRIVVCLSDSYSGPEVHKIYAIDPISAEELDLLFTIPLIKSDLAAVYRNEIIPPGAVEQAVFNTLCIAHKNKLELERNKIFDQAVDYAFKNCGIVEGEVVTQGQLGKLSALIVEKLMPYLTENVYQKKTPNLLPRDGFSSG